MQINTVQLTHKERKFLEHLLGEPIQMIGFGEVDIPEKIFREFENGQKKINSDYPLDYLLGEVEFLGKKFVLDENVLIPREETEGFVDYLVSKELARGELLLDIGTGSGVIGLSLAGSYRNVICSDISAEALDVCNRNIQQLDIKNAKIKGSDLLENNDLKQTINQSGEWDLVANLPYLPEIEKREAVENGVYYEPDLALYSGNDGLDLFRRMIAQLRSLKLPSRIFLELDPTNVHTADKMVADLGYDSRVFRDVHARERFIIGQLKNT